jgi:hypothetical protein
MTAKVTDPVIDVTSLKVKNARKVLRSSGVHVTDIGGANKDGTVTIDAEKIEQLKKDLGSLERFGTVKFIALNAPFMRSGRLS